MRATDNVNISRDNGERIRTDESIEVVRIVEEEIVSDTVAYHRLSIDLAGVFRHLRQQFWIRSAVATVVAALFSSLGLLLYVLIPHSGGNGRLMVELGAAALAAVASVLAIIGLHPVLRKAEQHLLETASIASHANIELLLLLGKLTELRGGDTAGHTLRVTLYTMLCANELQLPRETLLCAVKGALLHDVGKLVMPDSLLGKPGALTTEERAEMQQHVVHGLEIIHQSELLNAAVNVVQFHHERYDGGGYPNGAQGEDIPLEARLFALVDVFDALTSPRAYKAALPVREALDCMGQMRGSHFDPNLFDRFVAIAPRFEHELPREQEQLKTLLLEHLSRHLDLSEIDYLRRRLLSARPSGDRALAVKH